MNTQRKTRIRKQVEETTVRPLGRWEWVALPDFGISCIQARLNPKVEASLLASEEFIPIECDGQPGVRFRIYPLADDERTFVVAEAALARRPLGECGPRIRTRLSLGQKCWEIEVELVRRKARRLPLTLGCMAFGGSFTIDTSAKAITGFPWHDPNPHLRPRSRVRARRRA